MKNREELQIGILAALALFFLFLVFFSEELTASKVELYDVTNNVTMVSEWKADDLININTASAEELMELRGVGKVIAARILEYREQNGKFRYIEDIAKVQGISESMMEELRPYICV